MQATVEWFKIYKIPDGKPLNEFAFEGKPKVIPAKCATTLVQWCAMLWIRIRIQDLSGSGSTQPGKYRIINKLEAKGVRLNT